MVPLKITPAAEKTVHLAAGRSPVGEGGRGVKRMWGLIITIFLVIFPHYGIADSCSKCYQNVKFGQTVTQLFVFHTHINTGCYNQGQLESCKFGDKDLWVATNLGA